MAEVDSGQEGGWRGQEAATGGENGNKARGRSAEGTEDSLESLQAPSAGFQTFPIIQKHASRSRPPRDTLGRIEDSAEPPRLADPTSSINIHPTHATSVASPSCHPPPRPPPVHDLSADLDHLLLSSASAPASDGLSDLQNSSRVDGGRRGSEASVSSSLAPESTLPPPIESDDIFPTTRTAIFPTIQPTRTSRYKPPPSTRTASTRSASPPLSIASSQNSDNQSLASSTAARRPPPRPIVHSTSRSSLTGSPISSAASIRSSSTSVRSSSFSTTSTRLSDGPQSIFANPEHKSRSISELVSLPKFFKKGKSAPSGPPGRQAGGSASILDAALTSSQTWSNPTRAPPSARSSYSRSNQASLSGDMLAAAMARNPRRMSSASSLAGSEIGVGGVEEYGDGGGLRIDIFATKPKESPIEPQGLGLQGVK